MHTHTHTHTLTLTHTGDYNGSDGTLLGDGVIYPAQEGTVAGTVQVCCAFRV